MRRDGFHPVLAADMQGRMGEICETRIEDLAELIAWVTPEEPEPESGRLRARRVYRGVSHAEHSLLTSLDRLGMPERPPHAKGWLEEHLLRNFYRYSRPYLPVRPESHWEFLVVAQHHGLPTRLLDWSHSPLVAAHFATLQPEREQDRVVWVLDWGRMHDHFGLPPFALLVSELEETLRQRGVESPWSLFNGSAEVREPFACLLEPPALDARIVAQSAAFTFSTDKSSGLDEILQGEGLQDALRRCVIPKEVVNRLRDQLDLCGVDERRLFPDLDGVAAEMRRYYSASGGPGGDAEVQP